jgi:septin family protein
MKRLSKVVNIVPVIAKADTLTLEERVYFKQRVGLMASTQPLPLQDCPDK